jgi:hypothetical protein
MALGEVVWRTTALPTGMPPRTDIRTRPLALVFTSRELLQNRANGDSLKQRRASPPGEVLAGQRHFPQRAASHVRLPAQRQGVAGSNPVSPTEIQALACENRRAAMRSNRPEVTLKTHFGPTFRPHNGIKHPRKCPESPLARSLWPGWEPRRSDLLMDVSRRHRVRSGVVPGPRRDPGSTGCPAPAGECCAVGLFG